VVVNYLFIKLTRYNRPTHTHFDKDNSLLYVCSSQSTCSADKQEWRRNIMLRKISVVVVAAAVLITPVIASAAAMGGRGGPAHWGAGGKHSFGGARSPPGAGSIAGVRSLPGPRTFNAGGFPGHRFDHHYFRAGRIFVGGLGPDYSFSYDPSCWRWQATSLGFTRVYVCDGDWGN
jgi:hypothetical protein